MATDSSASLVPGITLPIDNIQLEELMKLLIQHPYHFYDAMRWSTIINHKAMN